jgi:hypothetical protein
MREEAKRKVFYAIFPFLLGPCLFVFSSGSTEVSFILGFVESELEWFMVLVRPN